MSSVNEALRDIGISHAIGLRRLSSGTVRSIIGLLDKTEADIVDQIIRLDPAASPSKAKRLEKLLREIRALNSDGYKVIYAALKKDLIDIGDYEAQFQARTLGQALDMKAGVFAVPSHNQLVAAVTSRPFQGRLLKEWTDGLEAGRFARVRDAIRMGVVEGESVSEIVRRIRGTKGMRFKDGILEISRRSATAMTRTAVNHITTQARDTTYQENADVLKAWKFVATLDSRTTKICMGLDGKEFPIGQGPLPPRHLNCRSVTVPVVKYGGKADRITYPEWLKRQSREVQDDALGPTRAELWRKGEVTIDKFADDNRVYSLDELARREGL